MREKDILPITDEMSDLEKFVRQEAMEYLKTTIFLSYISPNHPNINSVVEKGKDVVPYVVQLYREKGEDATDNMYLHFFLLIMDKLYENPFNGYVGMRYAAKYWLKRYDHGLLTKPKEEITNEEEAEFVRDFLGFKTVEDVQKYLENNAKNIE